MKWHGVIGFRETVEIEPGIWDEKITEKHYYGDEIRISRKLQSSSQVNDDIVISNQISIIADPYANKNMYSMIYVEFMGAKWKITDISVSYPRLTLTIGGLYNG